MMQSTKLVKYTLVIIIISTQICHISLGGQFTLNVEHFKENGLIFPISMDQEQVESLEKMLNLDMFTELGVGDPSTIDMHLKDNDHEEAFMNTICDNKILELLTNVLNVSVVDDIVLIGTDIFCKSIVTTNDNKRFVGWHQDQSWWKISPIDKLINLWIAFDDISINNGCVQFVIDENYMNTIFKHDKYLENNALKYSIQINETQYEMDDEIICAELSKYEGMMFSGLVIHGSQYNYNKKRRCGVVYRFTVTDFKFISDEQKYLRGNIPYNPIPIRVKPKCILLDEMQSKEEL